MFSCENRLNKLLHAAGTLPAHLGGNVAVNVQRKRRRCVAQVFLHRLNVIPAFYRCHGIRVPKLVEAENEAILVEVENGT